VRDSKSRSLSVILFNWGRLLTALAIPGLGFLRSHRIGGWAHLFMVVDDSPNAVGNEMTNTMNDPFTSNVAYSLKDVSFSYTKGKRAASESVLKKLSCLILSGRVLGILGPNGSGKSTLASVLAGKEGYEVTSLAYGGQWVTIPFITDFCKNQGWI